MAGRKGRQARLRQLRRAALVLGTTVLFGSIGTGMAAPPTNLFISEYIEGTATNDKAIEIYNGTGADISLHFSNYALEIYANGATLPFVVQLSGVVADGDVFVVAQAGANPSILAEADQVPANVQFSGNDAIVLRHGAAIVDVIGQIGFNPGIEWGSGLTSTADNTLRRPSTVSAGDVNPNDPFDPGVDSDGNGVIDWEGFPADTFGGLGTHIVDTDHVSATVTAAEVGGGASPCVRVAPPAISYGTGTFSSVAAGESIVNANSDITVTNCSSAPADFLAHGTNATAAGATWQLTDTENVCGVDGNAVDLYKLRLMLAVPVYLSTTDKTIATGTSANNTLNVPSQLTMPCTGSSGASRTLNLDLVFMAVLSV